MPRSKPIKYMFRSRRMRPAGISATVESEPDDAPVADSCDDRHGDLHVAGKTKLNVPSRRFWCDSPWELEPGSLFCNVADTKLYDIPLCSFF